MAAPILPSLFPRPPLGPPHHHLCFPPVAPWDLPPPPVQFYPGSNYLQPPGPPIIGAVNFVPGPGPGPGFRGRGCGYHPQQRGFRGRGRGGGIRRGGGQGGAQSGHVEKKVQKPAEFSCKVCNKDYRCEESYQIHLQSHQKCSSCDFEAVPRVLKEHELLHFLPDELKLTSPEDIKKWREDRKKNYPTAENIARKKKSDEEKKARGEVAKTPLYRYIKRIIGDEDYGRFKKHGRWGRGRGRGRGRERGRGGYRHHHQQQQGGSPWKNRRGRRHNNRGGRNNNASTIERDSIQSSLSESPTKSKEKQLSASDKITPAECKLENELNSSVMNAIMTDVATASTIAGGGTSSQCSGNRQEIKIEREDSNNQVSSDSGLVVPASLEGEKGREKKALSSTGCDSKVPGGSRKRKEMEGGRNEWVSRRKARPKRERLAMGLGAVRLTKPTLLEKLLAPEIRREQNAILQCIHHIVERDFFGLNSQPS